MHSIRRIKSALVICLGFMVITFVHAAGLQWITVPKDTKGPALQGAIWYPCNTPPKVTPFGPVNFLAALNCPAMKDNLPLVVISHGSGAWFGAHHDTAEALANAGFVVAAINHPGNSALAGMQRTDDLSALVVDRPTDMRRLIDYMLSKWKNTATIDPKRIAFFGFSRGGTTGLIAIGGRPNLQKMQDRCFRLFSYVLGRGLCKNPPSNLPPSDPRIRAAVLADPMSGALFADGLKAIAIPMQLWGSEYGGDGVTLEDTNSVARNLPTSPDRKIIPRAGHFSFLAPCSLAQQKTSSNICTDRAGFDRTLFHQKFNADIVSFLMKNL
ncbi:dienelactone hydrolase [Chromobacterium alkanivorans]|uniref:alpha/beta hydrolase family protein n=1 Tax=Chromobacterium alkanivorans TaxID=1071719 RepID=UPI001967515F|nr:dienelactone hydrolase [Chromobacterium alkanivorans]MBN3004223.1 dienelactone hydrolase [Chromobacterium alkanivorans]